MKLYDDYVKTISGLVHSKCINNAMPWNSLLLTSACPMIFVGIEPKDLTDELLLHEFDAICVILNEMSNRSEYLNIQQFESYSFSHRICFYLSHCTWIINRSDYVLYEISTRGLISKVNIEGIKLIRILVTTLFLDHVTNYLPTFENKLLTIRTIEHLIRYKQNQDSSRTVLLSYQTVFGRNIDHKVYIANLLTKYCHAK